MTTSSEGKGNGGMRDGGVRSPSELGMKKKRRKYRKKGTDL